VFNVSKINVKKNKSLFFNVQKTKTNIIVSKKINSFQNNGTQPGCTLPLRLESNFPTLWERPWL